MERAPVESFDPDYFAAHGYPHEAWTWMRAHAPVARYESADRQPFWAITRYKDIVSIGRDPQQTFISAPGVTILRTDQPPTASPIPLLLSMDPPQHGKHRGVMRDQFRPRAMQALDAHIVQRCHEIADQVAADRLTRAQGEAVDFVDAVAMRLPLDVILELLGVPTSDRDQMYLWSNAVIGAEDPDYGDVASPHEAIVQARMAIFGYFSKFIAERRVQPRDDLVSVLVQARVDGEPLTDIEVLGYCFVLMLAGNETTRNATSGSLMTLFEHPEAMARLTADPSLMPVAVEELLRWVSPIIYMARTAVRETEIGGQRIAEGDKVVMFYPSANRDESVFADPFRFDIQRTPNEHLTFGFGRHRCLGNDLARIELRAVLSEVLRRFPNIRPAGEVSRLRSNFVGGIKSLPVDFGEPVEPEMVNLTFVAHDGTERAVEAAPGTSVMAAAIENDVPGIDADCGGACACATCHVYVADAWADRVGGPNADEAEMLTLASDVRPTSRLSCQIKLSEALDGLVVETPASQQG